MAANLDLIKSVYGAFARGDVGAVIGALAPEISWTEAEGFPYGGTYMGPAAVLEGVFSRIGSDWNGFTAVPEEFVEQDDVVVALGMYGGEYRRTGKRFSAPFAHIWTLGRGKVIRFRQYTDTAVVQRALL